MRKTFFKGLLIGAVLLLTSCSQSGPPSVRSSSADAGFVTLSDKVEFVEQYLSFRRTYEALDFVVFYQNNSSGLVLGPSDWNIQLVAKIPKAEIPRWTEGLNAVTAANTDWLEYLPGEIDYSGISAWYASDNRLVGVDKVNAVIVYKNSSG